MANYVEYIQAGTGEAWPVRDKEAHDAIDAIEALKLIEDEKENERADYVIEQGTSTTDSGTWTYRKWNSGICEAWAYINDIAVLGATTVNNINCAYAHIIYPPIFSNVVAVNYTVYNTSGYDWCGKAQVENEQNRFIAFLLTLSSMNSAMSVRAHIIGTWE